MKNIFFFTALFFSSFMFGQEAFVTTWQTGNDGISCSSCISIPTVGGGYNYEVDWNNDGVFDEMDITGDVTHDFGTAGMYTIAIKGNFPRIAFDNTLEGQKIVSVDQWGDIQWTSFGNAFAGCINMKVNASDSPDLSNVTNLSNCFSQCILTGGCSNWDVDSIANFSGMFSRCPFFNEDLISWDVSSATNTSSMFFGALNFNQDIGNWDVSNVVNMSGMFGSAFDFNQDIGNWDVSNVETMASMFDAAQVFNQGIGNWDVSNVQDMSNMFGSLSQVVFPNPNAFNQDISNWDVSNVNNMAEMFMGCENFNQNIGVWNVSNVTTMQGMFRNTDSFDQSLGGWNLEGLDNAAFMLNNAGLSCLNYTSTLVEWAANVVTPDDVSLGARNLMYNAEGAVARDALIAKGWTISGDDEGACSTANDEVEESYVSVYPNPTKGLLFVESEKEGLSYQVLDLMGSIVVEGILKEGQINLEELPKGIFIVQFSKGKEVKLLQKIMKI